MKALLLLFLGVSTAAADAARDNNWRQDLDFLAAQLPQRHPNLFFQTPRAVFDQAVNDLRAAIPDLGDTQVMARLAQIVALPGDGHTNLFLTQRNAAFRLLPLRLRWFTDGLFVTAAAQRYGRAAGAKVLRIGDRSVEEAYQAVGTLISHENDSWVRETSPDYLINADLLQALGVASDDLSIPWQFQDVSGAVFTLDIESSTPNIPEPVAAFPDTAAGYVPLYQQQRQLNYWFTYIESSRTLYFAYNACAQMVTQPFAQFNSQLWSVFDSKPVDRMILDLRNNSGGDSSILAPFLASGAQRSARFASAQLYVIIGRRTFSSAIINAIQLHQGPVLLVGEPSGGSPNSYGEVQSLILPNSRLTVSYSTRYFSFPGVPPGALMPDVSLPVYSADYFARHDPFLAAALAAVSPSGAAQPAGSVVNAATFRAGDPVAPGSIATLFGEWTTAPADASSLPLPPELGGFQLFVNDTAAPLIAVRSGQVNFQLPAGTATGAAAVRLVRQSATVVETTARVASVAPGLFVADSIDPSRPGAVVMQGRSIQLYGVGQGATQPEVEDGTAATAVSRVAPRVYLGAELLPVLYSGTQPSFPGLWQINTTIPESIPAGPAPFFVVLGNTASNAVTVPVGGPF